MVSIPPDEQAKGLIRVFEFARLLPVPQYVDDTIAKLRRKHPNRTARELSELAMRGVKWRLTGAGVVASLPGAIPGLGTVIQIGVTGTTMGAETWVVLRNLARLQMVTAALHDHPIAHPEDSTKLHPDRLDELVIVFGLSTGVLVPAKEATGRIGTRIAVNAFNRHVSGKVFSRINQKLGTTVLTKFGLKRGGIAVGRLIPFGIGAAVGGAMNYGWAHGFGRACIKFYDDLKPGNEEIVGPG